MLRQGLLSSERAPEETAGDENAGEIMPDLRRGTEKKRQNPSRPGALFAATNFRLPMAFIPYRQMREAQQDNRRSL